MRKNIVKKKTKKKQFKHNEFPEEINTTESFKRRIDITRHTQICTVI